MLFQRLNVSLWKDRIGQFMTELMRLTSFQHDYYYYHLFHCPDITSVVDWALKIKHLSIITDLQLTTKSWKFRWRWPHPCMVGHFDRLTEQHVPLSACWAQPLRINLTLVLGIGLWHVRLKVDVLDMLGVKGNDRADRLAGNSQKQPSPVAFVSQNMRCKWWGAWDTTWRQTLKRAN